MAHGPLPAYGASAAWAEDLMQQAGTTVTFESNLTPSWPLYDAQNTRPIKKPYSLLNQFIQPAVKIRSSFTNQTVAPYGLPTHDYSPFLIAGSVVILGLAAYGTFSLVQRVRG